MKQIMHRAKKFIDQFRMRWGLTSLYRHDAKGTTVTQYKNCNGVEFKLKQKIQQGWYMLEIKACLSLTRVSGQVYLSSESAENRELYAFTLINRQTAKRIIKVNENCEFGFYVDIEGLELEHFRLIKLTERFAISRMQMKLEALHHQYKKAHHNRLEVQPEKGFLKVRSKHDIWLDYCDLFDSKSSFVLYDKWIKSFHEVTKVEISKLPSEGRRREPLISILMPTYRSNTQFLRSAIDSVLRQTYINWELCIADDASDNLELRTILEGYATRDGRIKLVFRDTNGHISAASNSALAIAKGDWIVLFDHDDLLDENALFCIASVINLQPNARMIYSDEDKVDETGVRSDPYFKPEWNQDLFYSQNMFSHLGAYDAQLMREVGGFRVGYEGSQDYDLALRCIERINVDQIHHIPRVLYHWRIHKDSTANSIGAKPYAKRAGEKALNDHFQRQNIHAKAESEEIGGGYRVRYALPNLLPWISIIIPTKNKSELLKKCIDSILSKTDYDNYEIIIVDNGSDERKAINLLKKLADNIKIRVVKDASPFNYSKLNNAAVMLAQGSVVALLNNDVEIINEQWLKEMLSHALRAEVGVVGAKLLYPDNTIQHAGVVLGIHGIAGHVHRFLPKDHLGYCGRASLIQSFSAVTGACMVMRKSVYVEVHGMNEDLPVACNDIDLCLKVRQAGYRNIWTPYAELYHHESLSRGPDDTPEKLARSAKEVAYMQQRWGDLIKNDPAYSPNLTLDFEDFSLAWPPRTIDDSNTPSFENH
jgi:O-antigen biosynthesis protein